MATKKSSLGTLNFGSPAFIRLIRDAIKEALLIERGIIRKPKHSLKPFLATEKNFVVGTNTVGFEINLMRIGNIDNETEFYFDEDDPISVTDIEVTSDNSVKLTLDTGNVVGSYNLQARNGNEDNYGNVQVHIASIVIATPGGVDAPWTDVRGNIDATEGTITSLDGTTGRWNSSALSDPLTFSGDGIVSATYGGLAFPTGSSPGAAIGLSIDPSADTAMNSIDYAIVIKSGSHIEVRELNNREVNNRNVVSVGDTIAVQRVGSVVTYIHNGVVIHTSTIPSVGAVGFDNSIFRNIVLTDITVSHDD